MLDEHAGRDAFVEVDGEAEQAREGLHRQADVDAVRGVQQEVFFEVLQDGVDAEHDGDADADGHERDPAVVHEDLVHDDLEEQRDDQADGADGEDGDGDLHQQGPLTEEFRDEPAEAELLIFVDDRIMLLHEDDAVGVFLFPLLLVHERDARAVSVGHIGVPDGDLHDRFRLVVLGGLFLLRFGGVGIRAGDDLVGLLDQGFGRELRLVALAGFGIGDAFGDFAHSAEDGEPAVLLDGHAGERRADLRELVPLHADFLRLVLEVVGDLAEEADGRLVLGDRVFVHQAADVGVVAVMLHDGGEAVEGGLLAVDRAAAHFHADEDGLAGPGFEELVLLEEEHLALDFCQRIEHGVAFLLDAALQELADAEVEHPVAVVKLKEDRRTEEGSEFLDGDVAAAFGREPQLVCELQAEFQGILDVFKRGQEGVEVARLRHHLDDFLETQQKRISVVGILTHEISILFMNRTKKWLRIALI